MSLQQPITVLVPAKNEAKTIGGVVEKAKSHHLVSEVLVVDHGSTDSTGTVAAAAGARVVRFEESGLGRAVKYGIAEASNDFILRTDGDISNWSVEWIDTLTLNYIGGLTRGYFDTPNETFPVTNLVVRPFFELYRKEWASIPKPLSGTYLFDRREFPLREVPDNWAIDIAILTSALLRSDGVTNVDLGILQDRLRPIEHYVPMARDITEYLVNRFVLHRSIEF